MRIFVRITQPASTWSNAADWSTELFPIYLRLAGANAHWQVATGTIKVHAAAGSMSLRILPPGQSLLLGPDCGEFLFVRPPGA